MLFAAPVKLNSKGLMEITVVKETDTKVYRADVCTWRLE